MSKPPLWTFAGYVTEAGGRVVQGWYDALGDVEREELQDTCNYLADIENWRRPEFDKVTVSLHKIRSKANQTNHEIRVYGVFDSVVRRRFIMLHAIEAK